MIKWVTWLSRKICQCWSALLWKCYRFTKILLSGFKGHIETQWTYNFARYCSVDIFSNRTINWGPHWIRHSKLASCYWEEIRKKVKLTKSSQQTFCLFKNLMFLVSLVENWIDVLSLVTPTMNSFMQKVCHCIWPNSWFVTMDLKL